MGVTDKIRQAFDECTVMAGVENDFECVYITKAAALLYLNEIDDENAKLRELVRDMHDVESAGIPLQGEREDFGAAFKRMDERKEEA